MVLSMSRPWKHPKTGIYWLRRGVPDDLRPIIGKREIKHSLKTKDPEIAKQEHLKALTDLEAQWRNLRAGSKTLSEREAHEMARAQCMTPGLEPTGSTRANRPPGTPTSAALSGSPYRSTSVRPLNCV
jgi:hypothetical protein